MMRQPAALAADRHSPARPSQQGARYEFLIPLPMPLPSPNSRLCWQARHRAAKLVRDGVAVLSRSARAERGVARASAPAGVKLILLRGKGGRMLDVDNAYGQAKPILDGIVAGGWLVGDDARWLTSYEVTQVRDPRGPAAIVEITL